MISDWGTKCIQFILGNIAYSMDCPEYRLFVLLRCMSNLLYQIYQRLYKLKQNQEYSNIATVNYIKHLSYMDILL